MQKDTDDMEDIIKLLIDLLSNQNISREYITNKLNEFHYCIKCLQHFNRCKCDETEDINSDNESVYDYTSSSCDPDTD